MDIRPALVVPPSSSPLRELAHAVYEVLTLPNPITTRDELTYLRAVRDRARLVREAGWKITQDREIDRCERDLMLIITALRHQAGQLRDHELGYRPEATL